MLTSPIAACGFNFDTTYTSLGELFFTKLVPVAVADPKLVVLNENLVDELGLDFSALDDEKSAALFSGNCEVAGAQTFAQAYAGHQFGYFTMLGDGRALVWGEHLSPDNKRVDIQFKGSGQTPYSRSGDGRAVLGPMLREYLVSEAMHSLRVCTTRSLAVCSTGEKVLREEPMPGAILTRVASSHIRVGTFEFAASCGDENMLGSILNYSIKRHYPHLQEVENPALGFIEAVMLRQADLIVDWMRVGFIHGVMNTDNMAISGQTIDYGPCAFMDHYHPHTVFSSIDHKGRYAFENQPSIAQWNLARLAESLLPLIHKQVDVALEMAEELIMGFSDICQAKYLKMMASKLGLFGSFAEDKKLIFDLLHWMQEEQLDYTNTFRDLCSIEKPHGKPYQQKFFAAWYKCWQARRLQNDVSLEASVKLMKSQNPVLIPRNHIVQVALDAAHEGDFRPFHAAIDAFREPYKERENLSSYQKPPKACERVYQTFCGT